MMNAECGMAQSDAGLRTYSAFRIPNSAFSVTT